MFFEGEAVGFTIFGNFQSQTTIPEVLSSSHGIYPGQGMSVAWSGFYRFTGWFHATLPVGVQRDGKAVTEFVFGLCCSYLCLRDWKSDQLQRRIQVVLGVIVIQGIRQTVNVARLSPHGYSRGTFTMYRTYAFGERSDAGVDPVRRYFDFELRQIQGQYIHLLQDRLRQSCNPVMGAGSTPSLFVQVFQFVVLRQFHIQWVFLSVVCY